MSKGRRMKVTLPWCVYQVHNKTDVQFGVRQSGMVLLVVLLMLVVLSTIAMLAIKEGKTGLKVTTAMQADKLLFQANEAAFLRLERQLTQQNNDGLLPWLLSDTVAENEQIIMCITADDITFSVNKITHKPATGGVYLSNGLLQTGVTATGYCDVTSSKDYQNAGRVLTQMYLTIKHKPSRQQPSVEGSSNNLPQINNGVTSCLDMDVQMISLMPIISAANDTKINACLQQTLPSTTANPLFSLDAKATLQCLAESSVVFMSHQQTYQVMTQDATQPKKENGLGQNCLLQANEQQLIIKPTTWMQIMP